MHVSDIQAGKPVAGTFLVAAAETRTTRKGDPYLRLTLRDATGATIDALYFGVSEREISDIVPAATYEIEGQGDEWQGRLNLKVKAVRRAAEQWDATALLPRSDQPADTLQQAIDQAASSIQNQEIRAVVQAVMALEPVAERLSVWPAAKSRHHAWLGGLAEHTVEMLRLADRVAEVFPDLDRDLLTAGVLLHDIGKVVELDLSADISYAASGNLEGHMVQGVRLLDHALAQEGCGEETAMLLRHLVLSHQGTRAFAAVVEPMTPEAIALHFIDQLSSQVRPAIEDVKSAHARGTRGSTIRGSTTLRTLYVPEDGGSTSADRAEPPQDLPF